MFKRDPKTPLGAVLSDRDILAAIQRGDISIYLKANPGNFQDESLRKAEIATADIRPESLESAGLALQAADYWDGERFTPLSSVKGYSLKPHQSVVLRSRHYFCMSTSYTALHFGLHRHQMAGIQIAIGQIQPGWGRNKPVPLLTRMTNNGRTTFEIKNTDYVSRLVILRLTSDPIYRGGTSEEELMEPILRAQANAEKVGRWLRLLVFVSLTALGVLLYFILPTWFKSLQGDVFKSVLTLVIAPLVVGTYAALSEIWPVLKVGGR